LYPNKSRTAADESKLIEPLRTAHPFTAMCSASENQVRHGIRTALRSDALKGFPYHSTVAAPWRISAHAEAMQLSFVGR
jgi:hypothetical protein